MEEIAGSIPAGPINFIRFKKWLKHFETFINKQVKEILNNRGKMDKGTKSFLGWAGIVLGILVFLIGFNAIYASVGTWANYILGILVFIQGIWLLSAK